MCTVFLSTLSGEFKTFLEQKRGEGNLSEFVDRTIAEDKFASVVIGDNNDPGLFDNVLYLTVSVLQTAAFDVRKKLKNSFIDPLPTSAILFSAQAIVTKVHAIFCKLATSHKYFYFPVNFYSISASANVNMCASALNSFRTQYTVVHKTAFETAPRVAMLFSNSCFYMSYHVLLLPVLYQSQYLVMKIQLLNLHRHSDLYDTIVDLAPKFRALGYRHKLLIFPFNVLECLKNS